MNTPNSIGLTLVGLAMAMFPALLPQAFPPTALDGSNTRALWLAIVGGAQLIIGISYLMQIWVNRLASSFATFTLPTLDRSPLPTPSFETGRVA